MHFKKIQNHFTWITTRWPGNVTPVPKTFTLLGIHCLSQCHAVSLYQTAAQLTNHARLDTHSNECMYFLFTEFLWVEPNTVPAINTKWDRNWLFIYLLNKVVWIAIRTTPICPSVQIKCRPQWVYTLLSYYFKINFNIIFPSISWSFKQCLTFWISDQNPVCTSLFPPWMSYALPSTSSLIWSPQYLAGTKNHDAPHVSMGFHHCVNEIFTLLGCYTV